MTPLHFRRRTFTFDRAYVVAIVNVTPDSFSDGGRHADVESAVAFALRCAEAGADLLDIGGESTRPGAREVPTDEELSRVVPVIRTLAGRTDVPISVDTVKGVVAAAALEAGAECVNDISGGTFDPGTLAAAADHRAAFVLGHVRGETLAAVHDAPDPTFADVRDDLAARLAALPAGLAEQTVVDPGLGFGKRTAVNLELLRRSGELATALGRPVMVGPSRKRFLGELTGRPATERDAASVGACLAAAAAGASFLRVHDVARLRDALTVFEAVRR
jgi:dihydropteroate synthase